MPCCHLRQYGLARSLAPRESSTYCIAQAAFKEGRRTSSTSTPVAAARNAAVNGLPFSDVTFECRSCLCCVLCPTGDNLKAAGRSHASRVVISSPSLMTPTESICGVLLDVADLKLDGVCCLCCCFKTDSRGVAFCCRVSEKEGAELHVAVLPEETLLCAKLVQIILWKRLFLTPLSVV